MCAQHLELSYLKCAQGLDHQHITMTLHMQMLENVGNIALMAQSWVNQIMRVMLQWTNYDPNHHRAKHPNANGASYCENMSKIVEACEMMWKGYSFTCARKQLSRSQTVSCRFYHSCKAPTRRAGRHAPWTPSLEPWSWQSLGPSQCKTSDECITCLEIVQLV